MLTFVASHFYFDGSSARVSSAPARSGHRPAASFQGHSQRELSEVKAELAALKARIGVQEVAAGSKNERVAISTSPDPEASRTRPTREEATLASNERYLRRRDSALTTLRLEARDDTWATEIEQSVERVLASLDKSRFPTTWLDRVRCKQTICEVLVKHDSEREGHDLIEEIVGIKDIRQTFGKTDEDVPGSFTTTVYLGRRGHELPR